MNFDFACYKPMDELVYRYNYFSSIEPVDPWSAVAFTSTSVIAASPNHKVVHQILECMLKYLKNNDYTEKINGLVGGAAVKGAADYDNRRS